MGLSASMWTSVSGLITHGERMNVIGNNIANVNTVGFKSQRMDFQDFVYQNSYSAAGITQIGRGVSIGTVMGDFSQGPLESTTSVTDLAITGQGFFKVSTPGTEQSFYTRAGNFSFRKDGYLENPAGYVLQGWKIDNTQGPARASGIQANAANTSQIKGSGLPRDVVLDTWTVNPLQSTKISYSVNLSPTATSDKSSYLDNPFASLVEVWNGKQPPAPNTPSISESAYSYAVPITVYDESGGKHNLTMYIDQVSKDSYQGASSNSSVYEYILTMDPSEDLRRAAIPNPVWKPGAEAGNGAASANSVFANKMSNPPTGASNFTLKPGYTLNTAKYSFDPTNNTPGVTKLDPFSPSTWPADTFTAPAGATTWPAADAAGTANSIIVDMKDTKSAGILMAGTLTFDGGGNLITQTAYVLNGSNKPIKDGSGNYVAGNGYEIDPDGNPVAKFDPNNLADSMYPTEVSSNGYPMIVANFTGLPGADVVGSVPDADKYLMEVDFGLRVSNYKNPWENYNSLGSLRPTTIANPLYDPAHPERGPAEFSASNRVPNPNYESGDPSRGPEYLYLNPNYDKTKNSFVDNGNGTYDITIGSPLYLYDGMQPADLQTYTWDGTTANFPPALQGVVSLDTASVRMTWGTSKGTPAVLSNVDGLGNMREPTLKDSNAFTATGDSNVTYSVSQNGYGRGDLASWTVDGNGILSGVYSNGVTLPLYQIAIYDFTCTQGLRREGGNLFSETLESGQPSTSVAGTNGKGSISAQTLEGSNADLSREFVNMIVTQRGFQSNSKLITTTDTMLETVINMKR